jgi:ABC-2 type transport system ATP-binding protein
VSKVYDLPPGTPGQAQVIAADRLDLEVPTGEVFGLVGPNGAGKTTTLKMICGLLVPTSGRITVNGIDVEQRPEDARACLGYLADFFSLYDDLKVWEYLDYFAHAYKMARPTIRDRIDEMIRAVGLEPKRDAFVGALSRGMKQRLGIARAILHDPPVLVLDEPAVGLDPNGRLEIKRLIKDIHARGATVLITSHLLPDLEELCTWVAIMEKGRLLHVGRLEQILRQAAGRSVRIKIAAPDFPLADWLKARPGVSAVRREPGGVRFSFAGGDGDLAVLIKALIGAGARVYAVEDVAETLEQVFAKLSSGEVM